MTDRALNLFYEEPDNDRFFPFDRYPRRIARRIVRGPARIGGQRRVFVNLSAGLRRLEIPFRVNDYRHARRNPTETVGIVGKPFVLDKMSWRNPIVFGAAVFSHPCDDPSLLSRLPIARVLVPGEWMRLMCAPYWGDAVQAWPVGIDTDAWCPAASDAKDIDVLIYDKVRWDREVVDGSLVTPIRQRLANAGRSTIDIRYGAYDEHEFRRALARSRSMVFLCEHETQGLAYQEALSCGVPVFAWDRGGAWRDPAYYPHAEVFGPVTSVPYWDARCGHTFTDANEFTRGWDEFWDGILGATYRPRDYILEHLTLERCAERYVDALAAVA